MQNKKFRLRNNLILNILFSFSSVTLALFGFLAVLPPASEPEASAIIDGEQFALTVTNSEAINLEINPTDSGSIAVAKDTIVANTNSPAGYKLYVSTDSESNAIHLNGKESNNTEDKKLVPTTGTSELPSQLENNSWGFAIAGASNFDSSYNTENPSMSAKFAAVPQKDAEQLIHDHTGRATDDQTEIYFAAKANTSIASGNYQTTILYTTLSEATDQDTTEINVEDGVLPADYTNKTVTLKTSIMLSRTPTLKVAVSNIEANNIQILNEKPLELSFTAPESLETGDHDLELTIINLAKSYTKPNALKVKPAIMNMQDMTPELCESLPLEEQQQFIDSRDGKIYWVAKLKDGNCWMTQNLDYDLDENITLTPADSDVAENWTPARSTIHGIDNLSSEWHHHGTVKDSHSYNDGSHYAAYSFDPGDYYYDGAYNIDDFCDYTIMTCDHYVTTPYDLNGEHGHVGNYYNWSAAVASDNTSAVMVESDTETSICPKGWRLPHGESSPQGNDFTALNNAYGGATDSDAALLSFPALFTRNSSISNSGIFNTSSNTGGIYWSQTVVTSTNANTILLDPTHTTTTSSSDRSFGFSVRCVARQESQTVTLKDGINGSNIATYNFESTYKLQVIQKEGYNFLGYSEDSTATTPTYVASDIITESKTLYALYSPMTSPDDVTLVMQDIANWKDTLELEQQVQAKDARDDKVYWVAKLKDGSIWMTQNLDYDLDENVTLTPADSDVTENWTPAHSTIHPATDFNWIDDINIPYSFDPGNYYSDGIIDSKECNYLIMTCDHFATTPYETNGEHGHIGNYYNWPAIIASNDASVTKSMATGMATGVSVLYASVNTSICPAGWRLPNIENNIMPLGSTYTKSKADVAPLLTDPLFFIGGGRIRFGKLHDFGRSSNYTSSNVSYILFNIYDDYFSPRSSLSTYYGYYANDGLSARCVAR